MRIPPLSPDEPRRLASLRDTNLLDSPAEDRFERITRLARALFRVHHAAVSLVDADRQWFKCAENLRCSQTPRDISFCAHAILDEDHVFVVPDALLDDRFHDSPLVRDEPRVRFYAGVPVTTPDGSRIGTLCVFDSEPRAFSADDRALLRDLAAFVGVEIRAGFLGSVNEELVTQLAAEHRHALIDPLTRIWNREGIFEALRKHWHTAADEQRSLAVVMADLDHFKRINDQHGHPAGDDVLRTAAKRLLGAIRSTDAVGRYGGEEFMAVLSPADDDTARAIAERIRRRFAETPFTVDDTKLDVTLSLGVALTDPAHDTVTADDLVAAADQALYDAKSAGRNRVVIAPADHTPHAEAA